MVFFTAGFTAVASSLSFLCHELAVNADVQEKLYEEITGIIDGLNGQKISYEVLQKMKYLDMVVSEGQRKYPVTVFIDRVATKQYVFEDYNGTKVVLQPGDAIWIPPFSFHHDQKFYPNPEQFDPERFSSVNKSQINLAAYVPFGTGPRACIASRFALMQLKATLFALVATFRFECNRNTQIPFKFKPIMGLDVEKGFWLQFKLRN